MTTYQSAQYGNRPGGILAPEDVAALQWADFVIRRYAGGKDYIDANDAAKMLEESYQHFQPPRNICDNREVQDYFSSLDTKRRGRLSRDDLK